MIILKTLSNEKVWGTSRLHKYSGDNTINKIGSVYSLSGIKNMSTEIISGDDNKDLYSAVKSNPEKFGLPKGIDYPIIIAFTAADEDLSIQVHPTDFYAKQKHDKCIGKTESWYFIEEPYSGNIYAESKLENKNEIKQHILEGDYKDVVGELEVKKKDLAHIEAGTIHALTKGSLVYEIQQSTDITYRLYDYDRKDKYGKKRELHLEDALSTLKVNNKVEITEFKENEKREFSPYVLERKKIIKEYKNTGNIAQVITVTKGALVLNDELLNLGMSCLILPGEEVKINNPADEVIIATPRLNFE